MTFFARKWNVEACDGSHQNSYVLNTVKCNNNSLKELENSV